MNENDGQAVRRPAPQKPRCHPHTYWSRMSFHAHESCCRCAPASLKSREVSLQLPHGQPHADAACSCSRHPRIRAVEQAARRTLHSVQQETLCAHWIFASVRAATQSTMFCNAPQPSLTAASTSAASCVWRRSSCRGERDSVLVLNLNALLAYNTRIRVFMNALSVVVSRAAAVDFRLLGPLQEEREGAKQTASLIAAYAHGPMWLLVSRSGKRKLQSLPESEGGPTRDRNETCLHAREHTVVRGRALFIASVVAIAADESVGGGILLLDERLDTAVLAHLALRVSKESVGSGSAKGRLRRAAKTSGPGGAAANSVSRTWGARWVLQ